MRLPVDLAGVLEALGNTMTITDRVVLDDVDLGAEHYSFAGPADYTVTFTNGGAGQIVATGIVSVTARATCVRCLQDFDLPVSAAIDAYYVLPGREAEIPDEQEYDVIHENRVDLYPALEQSVAVEFPFAPVHDAACKGICPVCGGDRNVTPCTCEVAAPSSPFAALKDMLPLDDDKLGDS